MSDFKSDLVNFFNENDPKHLNKVSRIAEKFRTPARQEIVMEHLHNKYNVPYDKPATEAPSMAAPAAEPTELPANEPEAVDGGPLPTEETASTGQPVTETTDAADEAEPPEATPTDKGGKKKKRGLFGRKK